MSFSPEGRVVVVKNPASTQSKSVERDVVERLRDNNFSPVIFETPASHRQDNIDVMREFIEPGDRIIVAGGDGTGNIAANAAIDSGQEAVQLGFLGYGNSNDMASVFSGHSRYKDPLALAKSEASTDAYPLRVDVNGEFDRHALLYASLGWTAKAAAAFNTPDTRQELHSGKSTRLDNFRKIANIYQTTKDSVSLADFRLGDDPKVHQAADILMLNGPTMAGMVSSGQNYYEGTNFLRTVTDTIKLNHNMPFISLSLLNFITRNKLKLHLPGEDVSSQIILFDNASVDIQTDGEHHRHEGVHQVTVSKEERPLAIITPMPKAKTLAGSEEYIRPLAS